MAKKKGTMFKPWSVYRLNANQRFQSGLTLIEIALAVALSVMISLSAWGMWRVYLDDANEQRANLILETVRQSILFFNQNAGRRPTLVELSSNNMAPFATRAFCGDVPGVAFPRDPFRINNSIVTGLVVTGAGGWLYDSNTGEFRINLLDTQYGTSGTVKKLMTNPSDW